jgi:hypothetical protein
VSFRRVADLLEGSDVCSSTSAKRDGLIINLGNVTSSVIPVLNGKGLMNRAKRWVSVLPFGMAATHTVNSVAHQDTMGRQSGFRAHAEACSAQVSVLPVQGDEQSSNCACSVYG